MSIEQGTVDDTMRVILKELFPIFETRRGRCVDGIGGHLVEDKAVWRNEILEWRRGRGGGDDGSRIMLETYLVLQVAFLAWVAMRRES